VKSVRPALKGRFDRMPLQAAALQRTTGASTVGPTKPTRPLSPYLEHPRLHHIVVQLFSRLHSRSA
jgi:hypothetical protein